MSTENTISRRKLLKFSALTSGLAAASSFALPSELKAQAGSCLNQITPPQTEGPFYPVHDQLDKDNDLTRIPGRGRLRADGQVVYVTGQVVDEHCRPIQSALVEIWQACKSGRYNHHADPNRAPLDPNFQYYGKVVTDRAGRYIFKTIIPGAYPASQGWVRPPHIHFKVARLGYHELTTQMYFAGHALNVKDRILMALPPNDRRKVVVDFKPPLSRNFEPDSFVGVFNVILNSVKTL